MVDNGLLWLGDSLCHSWMWFNAVERLLHLQAALDELIDRAGALVNLRTAISRYRKPRRRFRFFR